MKSVRKVIGIGFATITLIAFQNCGQAGQLSTGFSEDGAVVSNALEIDAPANLDDQPIDMNQPVVDDGQTVTIDEPVIDQPAVDEPGIETGGEAPVASTPVPTSSNGDVGEETTPSVVSAPVEESAPTVVSSCDHITASDVLLNIREITTRDGDALSITSLNQSISVDQSKLQVKALVSTNITEIRLVLNDSGNLLLGTDEALHDLKTPSGQSSGVKIKLSKAVKVVAGQDYELDLSLDLEKQIVQAGKKCLLKPVIKTAALAAI